MSGTAVAMVSAWGSEKARLRAGLSAFIRQTGKSSSQPPFITESMGLSDLADGYCHTSVPAKLRRVLERYEELTSEPGSWVQLDTQHDYPLADCASKKELEYLIATLHEQGVIEYHENHRAYRITADGWDALQPTAGGVPGSCFVAMSFDDDLKPAYENAIHRAAVECGFPSVRVDYVQHTENINDKILADIRRSQFIIADFTGHRNGVYFEAGFGLGLGKTVIWTCHKSDFSLDRIHFDTRPYNHIVWETHVELRQKLTDRIRAVIPDAKQ